MADWDFLAAPPQIQVRFGVLQTAVVANSIAMLTSAPQFSGLSPWIYDTHSQLTLQQRVWNDLLVNAIYGERSQAFYEQDFVASIQQLESESAEEHLARQLGWMQHYAHIESDTDTIMQDYASYRAFLAQVKEAKGMSMDDEDEDMLKYMYEMLSDSVTMKHHIIAHAHQLWTSRLQTELANNDSLLQESAQAFRAGTYDGMDTYDVIEHVTGRNMRAIDKLGEDLQDKILLFVPSMHIGPYVGWMPVEDDDLMIIFYGARLPRTSAPENAPTTALTRSELLMRLNALADDTRLKMLKLLTEREEICAQDFINELNLSQSSTSRHLRQLTASGYVNERRRDVAKCYSLNHERVEDTLNALARYLKTQ
jgi:DNA-binding transcriptional ArsR family regulator